jgi:hypothetical protein
VVNISLQSLAHSVKRLASLFLQVDFEHVYKEQNVVADDLSKVGLSWKTLPLCWKNIITTYY